jgi:diguanylate cyclase (GGDEF)-like protein
MSLAVSRAQVLVLSYSALLLLAIVAWHTERLYVGGLAIMPLLFIAYHTSRTVSILTALLAGVVLAMLDRDMLPGAGRIVLPPAMDAVILASTLCATVVIAENLRRSSLQNLFLRQRLHNVQRQAERDALTGIPNRVYFLRHLSQRIASTNRRPAAVLFADLDGFKAINDGAGHVVGDTVLELAAERLQHALRSNDVLARIGGDEFAVLIDMAHRSEVYEIIRHVERVMADPFRVGDRQFMLGITVGASFYPDDATDAKALLCISDSRMYREKAAKRRIRQRPHVAKVD